MGNDIRAHRRAGTLIALAATLAAVAGDPAAATGGSSTEVRLLDLGTLGTGNFSMASAMNDRGDIIGTSNAAPGSGDIHVVMWRDGRVIDLGSGVGDLGTHATAVNNSGQVVGCIARSFARSEAFVWKDGRLIMLGDGCAAAVNERGQVVGSRPTPDGLWRAFLWERGTMTDLPTPEGANSGAVDINDRGQIVGELSSPLPGPPRRAVIWDHGSMTELGTLGGSSSAAGRINNRGQVIGTGDIMFEPIAFHPFLWERGRMTDLASGTFDGGGASDINDAGEVVGSLAGRPFLWRNGARVDLGFPGSAVAINERGQFTGLATEFGVPDRPFLWSRGRTTYLDGLDGLFAYPVGIDSRGRVAGFSGTASGSYHAVVWHIGSR